MIARVAAILAALAVSSAFATRSLAPDAEETARGMTSVAFDAGISSGLALKPIEKLNERGAEAVLPEDTGSGRIALSQETDREITTLHLPATFTGDVPCTDCDALRYHLNLWPDGVYHLRRDWLGADLIEDSIGKWSLDRESNTLVLAAGEDQLEFEVLAPDRLRVLQGDDAVSPASEGERELIGFGKIEPLDLRLPIRGVVTFLADLARIEECSTGRVYPLLREGDFDTLEEAYLAAGVAQGTPLLASFDGGIIGDATGTSGTGTGGVVVVERFTGVWPDETCEPTRSEASLTNTHWKILRLGETDIVAGEERSEPYLTLNESDGTFEAWVGCNQISGRFTIDGDRLSFAQGAATLRGCPPPLDEWERQFGDVIGSTAAWRIDGQALDLLDEQGQILARFEAVYLR